MPDLTPYVNAAAFGTSVARITGVTVDGVVSAGFAAWIQSITNETPQVIALPDNRAKIALTQSQTVKMRDWLDSQVRSALTPKDKRPTVEYDLGPVFGPWALKYALPVGISLFLAGWILSWYVR